MKFDEMDEIECENHLDMVDDYEKLEFKLCSLRDILWFKHGDIKMKLPEGIEYPNGYGKKKGKCLRKILSKFRKH
jgi:hypothetical protein